MKTFYQLLGNNLIANVTNNFVWFAVTFWVYLETQSVLATAFVAGIYLVATALSGFWFGSIVDHNKKKTAMLISSLGSFVLYLLGLMLFLSNSPDEFKVFESIPLWSLILLLMAGVIIGNIRMIALPTVTTILVPEKIRDKANGLTGAATGIAFAITSAASGFILAYFGMLGVILVSIGFTLLAIIHLSFITIREEQIIHTQEHKIKKIDIKGTILVISAIPGLFALIFFTTFNNFLGGVFMALMDAYALTLVAVEVWGTLLAIISFGFILGGLIINKKGLGKNPLKTLFLVYIIMWVVCVFFAIQASVVLLIIGMFIWITIHPYVEATEQTIIQKVVPLERQGRVFGFANSVEQAASPLTAFLMGPIAQFIFIPFMTTGEGVELIGGWFGTGPGRGMALVFIISGIIGLVVTLIAMRSKAYRLLSERYKV